MMCGATFNSNQQLNHVSYIIGDRVIDYLTEWFRKDPFENYEADLEEFTNPNSEFRKELQKRTSVPQQTFNLAIPNTRVVLEIQ